MTRTDVDVDVFRTYYIWYSLFETMDTTWYAYPLWIAAAVEVQLAVVSFRLPPSTDMLVLIYAI